MTERTRTEADFSRPGEAKDIYKGREDLRTLAEGARAKEIAVEIWERFFDNNRGEHHGKAALNQVMGQRNEGADRTVSEILTHLSLTKGGVDSLMRGVGGRYHDGDFTILGEIGFEPEIWQKLVDQIYVDRQEMYGFDTNLPFLAEILIHLRSIVAGYPSVNLLGQVEKLRASANDTRKKIKDALENKEGDFDNEGAGI